MEDQEELVQMERYLDFQEEFFRLLTWRSSYEQSTRRTNGYHRHDDEELYSLFQKLDMVMDTVDFILNNCPLSLKHKAISLRSQVLNACEVLFSEATADLEPLIRCMERMRTINVPDEEASKSSRSSSLMEIGSEVCAICQEELNSTTGASETKEMKATQCGHKFHGRCVFKWLRSSRGCPICRFQLF